MVDSGITLDRSQADALAGILSERVMSELNTESPELAGMAQGMIGGQLDSKLDEIFEGKEQVSVEELQASLNGAVKSANDTGIVDISEESITITSDDLARAGVETEIAQAFQPEEVDGYAIPDVVEEKGFFEKIVGAFMSVLGGGDIMEAIASVFGSEENKGVEVTKANAALDVNQDSAIDAKDLHAMDLDKDGRLQESEIDRVVKGNEELRAELDGVMSELGIKTDGRHIEEGETVHAGVGGSAPSTDEPEINI